MNMPIPRLTLLILAAFSAHADINVYEREPNNKPANANEITAPVTVYGTMSGQDQDGYLWTVSDEDARKRWTLELIGIPGRLTIVEVIRFEFAENGVDVASTQTLMTLGSRDGRQPAVAEDLLFEPGNYLLGIAKSGGAASFRPPTASVGFDAESDASTDANPADTGAYRLHIREGRRLSDRPNPGPRPTLPEAHTLTAGQGFATYETEATVWYQLTFDAAAMAQRWDLTAQAPVGRHLQATLTDEAGKQRSQTRTDARGQLRFRDLAPREGGWFVKLETRTPGMLQVFESLAGGQRIEGAEAEPNDQWSGANRFDAARSIAGRAGDRNDTDVFAFDIGPDLLDQQLALTADSAAGSIKLELCLLDDRGQRLQCRQGDTPLTLPDLVLSKGTWGALISRMAADSEYSLSLRARGPIKPDRESEPNDLLEFASGVPERNVIRGRFSGDDEDHYRFTLATEPQLWRFQVVGEGVEQVYLLNAAGKVVQRKPGRGARRVRLDNVFLLPGIHYLKVEGKDADYTVVGRAEGPPDVNGEFEPNDDPSTMQQLAMGQTRTGLLSDTHDTDVYRFFLANRDHIRLRLQPPVDGQLAARLFLYDQRIGDSRTAAPGELIELSGVFPPGDYRLSIEASQPSEAEYTLGLDRLPRFACRGDCEPNGFDVLPGSATVPLDGRLTGTSGTWGDDDVFSLPKLDQPAELIVKSESDVRLSLGDTALEYDPENKRYNALVPAGDARTLVIGKGVGAYDLELALGDLIPAAELPSVIDLSVNLDAEAVAGYLPYGQALTGTLSVTNRSSTVQVLRLEAAVSDHRWHVDAPPMLEVSPGAGIDTPITLTAPRDAWADRTVRLSVRASNDRVAPSEAQKDITVSRTAPAVAPVPAWPVPASMLGGLNMASSAMGGTWAGSNYQVTRPEMMFNEISYGYHMVCCHEHHGWGENLPELTVALPDRVPVAGIALTHRSGRHPFKRIRKATVFVSEDGERYRQVASISPILVETEQFFPFPEVAQARFVRLRIDANNNVLNGSLGIGLGEWRVIAEPSYDPTDGAGLNIAAPRHGGHLVADFPTQATRQEEVLDGEKGSGRTYTKSDERLTYVVGFSDNRAAKIRRMEWDYGTAPDNDRLKEVSVARSMNGPVGPWETIDRFELDGSSVSTLEFEEPVWGRFFKFTGNEHHAAGVHKPRQIRIYETAPGESYASIVGAWGSGETRAIYEYTHGLDLGDEKDGASNTSRDRARELAAEEIAESRVSLGGDHHWYQVRPDSGHNLLRFTLDGTPTVRTRLRLEQKDGEAVTLRRVPKASTTARHVYEGWIEPGEPHWLEVYEPPRNVVFAWDTSPSVNQYLPTIYNSLAEFANGVRPGYESVNLVPYGRGPLLDTWVDQPYRLHTILNDYPRRESSSAGESAVARSARLLAPRNGTKAILTLTDGRVNRFIPLWPTLQEVQPRIFTVHIGGLQASDVDVLQDWSAVNGGHFQHIVYDGDMAIAFDRATTLMRRPAPYAVSYTGEYREAPGPGRLLVEAAGTSDPGGKAIELILDASGSMLQRLDGERRINIAKAVLTKAVQEHIPAGTPVALRVFGHQEPNACRTDLEMPLGPLNPARASEVIDGIQARNLARTPIADSLAAIRADTASHEGAVAAVLVTDGEETCDGDPAAALEQLAEQGIEVSLNIVGFAIDDPELEAKFAAWADQGNGRYLAARDSEGLDAAIEQALSIAYAVYDAEGVLAGEGVVGGTPLELEAGEYRVVVRTLPPRQFDAVRIAGEERTTLSLSD